MKLGQILIAAAVAAMIAVPIGAFSKTVSAESSSEGGKCVLGEYFGADWCGYCPSGAKANEDFAQAHPDYIFIKYDADETNNVNILGAAPLDRLQYYSPQGAGIPYTAVDGMVPLQVTAVVIALEPVDTFEQRYTVASSMPAFGTISLAGSMIDVSGGYENAKIVVKVKVGAAMPIVGADLAMFVAPIENNVSIWQEDWDHVYTEEDVAVEEWQHVVRQLNQYAFSPLSSGSFEATYEYSLSTIKSRQAEDEENLIALKTPEELAKTLGITVFIQDLATRTMFGSAQIAYLPINGTVAAPPAVNITENETAADAKTPGFGPAATIAGVAAVLLCASEAGKRRKR